MVQRYDAVLFDNDGVLVEPPPATVQAEATREAFAAVGIDTPARRDVDALVAGVTSGELAALCGRYDVDPAVFWTAWERHDERSQRAAFRSGDRSCYDDVAAIADLAQPCGVVSNNHHTTIAFALEFFELADLFDTFYGREKTVASLDRQKPNTHYLERARRDLEAETVLYVGDSGRDVVAADRAGFDSVFLRRSHCRGLPAGRQPTYEIESLTELPAVLDR